MNFHLQIRFLFASRRRRHTTKLIGDYCAGSMSRTGALNKICERVTDRQGLVFCGAAIFIAPRRRIQISIMPASANELRSIPDSGLRLAVRLRVVRRGCAMRWWKAQRAKNVWKAADVN